MASYRPNSSGQYHAVLSDENRCSFKTNSIEVSVLAALSRPFDLDFDLFPNPAYDILYIHSDLLRDKETKILLYSMEGKLVLSKVNKGFSSSSQLNVSALNAGVYLIEIVSNTQVLRRNILIE